MSITSAVPWIVGAVVGIFMWHAILRLPAPLARWICAPFGEPSRAGFGFAVILALVFVFVMAMITLSAVCMMFLPPSEITDMAARKGIGAKIGAASIAGYFAFAIVQRFLGSKVKSRCGTSQRSSEPREGASMSCHPERPERSGGSRRTCISEPNKDYENGCPIFAKQRWEVTIAS